MHVKGTKGAVVATILAALLWGSSFSVIKLGLRSIDPYWFVFLRFTLAAAVALAVTAATGRLREALRLMRHPLVILLGVSNAIGFVLQFKGQTLTTAGKAALFVNSSTIFVAIASRFVFRERMGPVRVAAVALGMIGVAAVTTGGRFTVVAGPELLGDALVLAAALTWTVFILVNKAVVAGHTVGLRALTSAMVTVTALTSLPVALVLGRGDFPAPSAQWWAIAHTAVLCTVIPFFLWSWGLKHISATTSSVLLLTEIAFALLLAAVLLGERLSPGALAGSLLIVISVLLASREARKEIVAGPDVVPD